MGDMLLAPPGFFFLRLLASLLMKQDPATLVSPFLPAVSPFAHPPKYSAASRGSGEKRRGELGGVSNGRAAPSLSPELCWSHQ